MNSYNTAGAAALGKPYVGLQQTAVATDSQSQIREAVGLQERYNEELHNVINALQERLQTVLWNEPANPTEENQKDPMALVPLAARIKANAVTTRNASNNIQEILRLLEL